jgi:hypothetical protein
MEPTPPDFTSPPTHLLVVLYTLAHFGIVPSMTFPWVLKDLKSALEELPSKRSNQSIELTPGSRTTQLSDG